MPEATAPSVTHAGSAEDVAIWPAHSSDWLRLSRLWQRSRQFSLVLAAVDHPDYRDGLIARLNALAPAPQITLHAQDSPHDWLSHLQHAAATAPDPSALRVHVCFPPHRTWEATWWQRLNGLREPLAAAFAGTLLVWLNDADISIAAHEAPDLWNWRTAVLHFVTPPLESLQSPAVQGERFTPLSGTDAETANTRLHHIETYLHHADDAQSNAYLQQEAADILYRLGRFTDSQTYAEQAAAGFEQAGNALSAAHAKGQIADILEARGRLDEALRIRETEVEPVLTRLGYAADADVARRRMADLQARLHPQNPHEHQ